MDKKQECLQAIEKTGIIAVLRKQNIDTLKEVIKYLKAGGINIFEITLDTPGALKAIEEIKQKDKDIILGAGTVLDGETARAAILAGADFIFAPNLNYDVIKVSKRYGKVVIPGVMSPTEIMNAYEAGGDIVKIFPAGVLGPEYIKSVRGPLGHVPMMPTGGVTLENAGDYIKAGVIAIGIGGELVDKEAIERGELIKLEEKAKSFINTVKEARRDID